MKRSWRKIHLHLPNPNSPIPPKPNPNPSKFSRQSSSRNQSTSTSSSTSSSLDPLDGLIDPHFNSPENKPNPQAYPRVASNPAEELAILKRSLFLENADPRKSSDAHSICDTIRAHRGEFGGETERFLARFRGKLSESLVVDVLKLVQNPDLGVKFFIWAGRQIGYNHTLAVYNALLDVMRCNLETRIPDRFLREIENAGDGETLGKLLNVLIRNHCRNGSWNEALEELGRLKGLGQAASKTTYNALVRLFVEAHKPDSAALVYREMAQSGHRMDPHTLGCLVYSLCRSGRWPEALEIIELERFQPDTILYTRMIAGLCDGSFFEEAMEFLGRMRASSCVPNAVTFGTLLAGCLNKGKLGRCKRVLAMMTVEGCYPSLKLHNSLVHAYCKSGDFTYAFRLLTWARMQPGYVAYNVFIGAVCGADEPPGPDKLELAEKAYRRMLDAGLVLNKVNVVNYVHCLCGAGQFEAAYRVIREMMNKGFVPDDSTYSKVIGFLCDSEKLEKAVSLFTEMKKNGVRPSVHTYTVLIDGFCKAGLVHQAHRWFDEMGADGCPPNVVTFTAMIHAYLKARKIGEADRLFETMVSGGCFPNVVTITALIDGHCKAGDVEKAFRIFSQMKGEEVPDVSMYFRAGGNDALEPIQPNIVTYGALVDGLCKARKAREASELFDTMVLDGHEPNCIVYDALIDGLCKAGRLDEAEKVYAKMCGPGPGPNIFTYASMIDRMFKDKRLDVASRVLSNMLESSCPPNVVVYTVMVDGLCKVGKAEEAYRMMEMMEAKGCKPNVVTYTAMIDGFGKTGQTEKSVELFRRMGRTGCAPNHVTYRVLVHHLCTAWRLDEARGLLEEMKQTHWPAHAARYGKVVKGFSREFLASLRVLDDVSERASGPVAPVYVLLVDGYRKAGNLDAALELVRETGPPWSLEDRAMWFSLIESLSGSCRVEKAFEVYADMVERGVVPELRVAVDLVKGLVKVSRWEDAVRLAEGLCYTGIQRLPFSDAREEK